MTGPGINIGGLTIAWSAGQTYEEMPNGAERREWKPGAAQRLQLQLREAADFLDDL